jgi:hypothetical protein
LTLLLAVRLEVFVREAVPAAVIVAVEEVVETTVDVTAPAAVITASAVRLETLVIVVDEALEITPEATTVDAADMAAIPLTIKVPLAVTVGIVAMSLSLSRANPAVAVKMALEAIVEELTTTPLREAFTVAEHVMSAGEEY